MPWRLSRYRKSSLSNHVEQPEDDHNEDDGSHIPPMGQKCESGKARGRRSPGAVPDTGDIESCVSNRGGNGQEGDSGTGVRIPLPSPISDPFARPIVLLLSRILIVFIYLEGHN